MTVPDGDPAQCWRYSERVASRDDYKSKVDTPILYLSKLNQEQIQWWTQTNYHIDQEDDGKRQISNICEQSV